MLSHVLRPLLAATVAATVPEASGDPKTPFEVGIEERVEVQLVLLDIVALDRDERTVPDLAATDFELLVDGKTVAIETFDRQCPATPLDEPHAYSGGSDHPDASSDLEKKIVLAFDFYHMSLADLAMSLGAAREAIETGRIVADQMMIVFLGGVLRVEVPFTSDSSEILRTLERMGSDLKVYGAYTGRMSERPFFRRMHALFDLMETVPGRKAIVLFSGPFVPDGFHHDLDYARLAAMSGTARASIYPVDAGGMRTQLDPAYRSLGGPPELWRLAVETGGRSTADTNDLALAMARAERDLGCVYTLGFHDRKPRLDRNRRVTVMTPERRGVRLVAPASYVRRSAVEKSRSLADLALHVPEKFASPAVDAALVLSRPRSQKRWEASLVVTVRPDAAWLPPGGAECDVRGLIRNDAGTIVRSFRKRLTLASPKGATHSETMTIRPGRYVLSAVVSRRGMEPLASRTEVVVPPIEP